MSKLGWDAIGRRFYETGVDNVVLYPRNSSGVAWNGVISIAENNSGAEYNDIYANNHKYLSLLSVENFTVTLEAYQYPSEFKECDGQLAFSGGLSFGQQIRKRFGLSYRTIIGNDINLNEHGTKIHILYNCLASPAQKTYQTKSDSPEAITFSWEISVDPIIINGYKPSSMVTIDSIVLNPTSFHTIETILHGSESKPPRLPMPSELVVLCIPIYEAIQNGMVDFRVSSTGHVIAEVENSYEANLENMSYTIDDSGHLIYQCYDGFPIDCKLVNGHLVMEVVE